MAQTRQKIKSIVTRYIRNLESLGISVQKVILFGSQATETFKKHSDIDIAIISKEFEIMSLWERAKYLGKGSQQNPLPHRSNGIFSFSVDHLKKIHKGGIKNGEVYQHAAEKKMWIITRDADFQSNYKFVSHDIGGIILIKLSITKTGY